MKGTANGQNILVVRVKHVRESLASLRWVVGSDHPPGHTVNVGKGFISSGRSRGKFFASLTGHALASLNVGSGYGPVMVTVGLGNPERSSCEP